MGVSSFNQNKMKILREADLIKTNSIDEVKEWMLYKVLLLSAIVGLPILIYNLYMSVSLGVGMSGIIHLILFLPLLLASLFFRKIKYKTKAYILIFSFILLSGFNFYIAAYAGAAFVLLLASSTFAAAFLGRKGAFVVIIICIIVASISAFLFISGFWEYEHDFYSLITSASSWFVAVMIYSFLAFLFLAAYRIIQGKLVQKIDVEHNQNVILEQANEKYRKLLEMQKSYQKELLIAKQKAEESNRLKTEFLHNMSHEVRTPLNGIMGFSRLMKKDGLSEEKRTQFSDIIYNSGEKLQRVIDDILEISFLETKQVSFDINKFNVFDFLQDLFLIFNLNSISKIDIRMQAPEENTIIETDQHKIYKILSNLIENAVKFTETGYVEFGVYYVKTDIICFYVKDTGIGISPEKVKKIFNRFSQENDDIAAKYGGLGLGLCIAQENSKLLGGNIRLESEKNVGTTFFVEIPVKFEAII